MAETSPATRIPPTVGRVVLYHPAPDERHTMQLHPDQPNAATITFVCSPSGRYVHLSVCDHAGTARPRQAVRLVQPGEMPPDGEAYCTWMPWQIGQAQRHEAQDAARQHAETVATLTP